MSQDLRVYSQAKIPAKEEEALDQIQSTWPASDQKLDPIPRVEMSD